MKSRPHSALGGLEILEQIRAHAQRDPERTAICAGSERSSYRGLLDGISTLARSLQSRNATNDRVAVDARSSLSAVVSALGVLQAGGTYVPIDPSWPASRRDEVIRLTGASVFLSDRQDAPVPTGTELIDVRTIVASTEEMPLPGGPSMPAYILFTSGSTGHPRGVVVSRQSLDYSTATRRRWYGPSPERFLLLSPLAFDSSVAGLFWTLAAGGCLVIADEDTRRDPRAVAELISKEQITHLLWLPRAYDAVLNAAERTELSSLEQVIVAGEACHPHVVARHFERLPEVALSNEYGPTEGTVWATARKLSKQDSAHPIVSVGEAIPGTEVRIVDEAMHPAPAGTVGELCIIGPGVADGYLGGTAADAARFFEDADGRRGYHTGDLALLRENNSIELHGRKDLQVKLRGYRIELGDIEAQIASHPKVTRCAVLLSNTSERAEHQELIAWVECSDLSAAELQSYLVERLPSWMIPSRFGLEQTLPSTSNEKLDRVSLSERRAPTADSEPADSSVQSPAERLVSMTMASLLGCDPVSASGDFFQLGGDSLLVLPLIHRLDKALGVKLTIRDIFEGRTVSRIAASLEKRSGDAGELDRRARASLTS